MQWTYEHYKGVHFKLFHDKLERIEMVDDRTLILHFREPFVDFLDLYDGGATGIGWIVFLDRFVAGFTVGAIK